MPDTPSDVEQRFLERIERRMDLLKVLLVAELGVYLPADETQRKRAIETFVRMTARQRELHQIRPEVLDRATALITQSLEGMQKILPNDVQYRNRIRRHW